MKKGSVANVGVNKNRWCIFLSLRSRENGCGNLFKIVLRLLRHFVPRNDTPTFGIQPKKIICFTLCFCLSFIFTGCKKEIDPVGKISDKVNFKMTDDNLKVWITNKDIETVEIGTNSKGGKFLTFKTTKDGKTALFNATKENLNKALSVTVDQYSIMPLTVSEPIEDGKFTFKTDAIELGFLYNYLTDAKDKMQGLTPPKYLISEEDAKAKLFEKAETAANKVTNYSCDVTVDPDFFGWKYTVKFTADGRKFEGEVNARTGGVIGLVPKH